MKILKLIGRNQELFEEDIEKHEKELISIINNSSFLIIGRGGNIGSATVKEIFEALEHLMENEESYVTADSAYISKENKKKLRKKRIVNGIIERRVRGQKKLRNKQQKHNKHFTAVRSIVELPFAFIKHIMHYTTIRFIGLEKNDQYHLLLSATYNLKRAPGVQRKLEKIRK